jgi:hypothetical protein
MHRDELDEGEWFGGQGTSAIVWPGCCVDGEALAWNADGEHELRRGSTDSKTDGDGVDELQRRRGKQESEERVRESGSSGRKRALLWKGEEICLQFIEGEDRERGSAGVMPLMTFKELEWREGLTNAVKVHNEGETDTATRLRVHGTTLRLVRLGRAPGAGSGLAVCARRRGKGRVLGAARNRGRGHRRLRSRSRGFLLRARCCVAS